MRGVAIKVKGGGLAGPDRLHDSLALDVLLLGPLTRGKLVEDLGGLIDHLCGSLRLKEVKSLSQGPVQYTELGWCRQLV